MRGTLFSAEANGPLETTVSSALVEDLANEVLGELNER